MHEPDCEAGADIILSSEEGDTTDEMLEKTLEHFKVIHGSELVAEDFQQGVRVTIHVEHTEKLPDGHKDAGFQILGQQQVNQHVYFIQSCYFERYLDGCFGRQNGRRSQRSISRRESKTKNRTSQFG